MAKNERCLFAKEASATRQLEGGQSEGQIMNMQQPKIKRSTV